MGGSATAGKSGAEIQRINNNAYNQRYGTGGVTGRQGMVVPGTPQTNVKNNHNNQGYADLLSNPQSQSAWPFKDVQAPNGGYVSLSSATSAYRNMQETPTAPMVEQPPEYNIQYPEYPTYSGMSREEALRQASGQIDPLAELAQMNLNDTYAQQRARLPQYLNARGQLYGGLRAGGESEITNEQAMALDKSRLGFNAQKEEVASALQMQDEARAKSLADQQYQSELNNANLAFQKWQTDMTNYTRSQEESNKNAQWLKNYELQLAAANRLANQDAYQQEQDQFSNDLALAALTGMYGGQPTMDYQRMQYDISKPYYSPNTGGGISTPKPTQTDRQNTATGDVMDAVSAMKSSGYGMQSVYDFIQGQMPQIQRDGGDMETIINYIKTLYGMNSDYPTSLPFNGGMGE